MASYSSASFVHLGILQKFLISDICRTLLVQQSQTTMADKQEINKNTANNQSCSLSAKFVSTLGWEEIQKYDCCTTCGSDDPVVALCINCTLCLCEDCNKCHKKKSNIHDIVGVQPIEMFIILYCTKHPKNELDFYCQDCQNLICLSCSLKEHVDYVKCSI